MIKFILQQSLTFNSENGWAQQSFFAFISVQGSEEEYNKFT